MRSFARLFLLLFGLAPGSECPVDLGIGSLWCYFHAASNKQSGHFIRDGHWLTKLKSISHLGEKGLWWRFAYHDHIPTLGTWWRFGDAFRPILNEAKHRKISNSLLLTDNCLKRIIRS